MSPYVAGVSWGNIWAGQSGIEDALGNLLALRVGLDLDEWCQWFVGADQVQPAYQRILAVRWPDAADRRAGFDAFWSFPPNEPSRKAMLLHPDFVLGFADGALEVWDKNHVRQNATQAPSSRPASRRRAQIMPRKGRQRP